MDKPYKFKRETLINYSRNCILASTIPRATLVVVLYHFEHFFTSSIEFGVRHIHMD